MLCGARRKYSRPSMVVLIDFLVARDQKRSDQFEELIDVKGFADMRSKPLFCQPGIVNSGTVGRYGDEGRILGGG